MKVFLDVGAHTGQTLAAAQRWDFDRIACFEPAAANVEALRKIADERTEIYHCGLLDRTTEEVLYNTGSQGASLWKRPNRPLTAETCKFVRASDWLRENLREDDTVWMKLNAEGSEVAIVTDMLDSGMFERIDYLLVMWDARKIPEIAGCELPVQARLAQYGAPRVLCHKDIPPAATHTLRIDNWLYLTDRAELR